jgi:two-component system response regulator AtoC
MIEIAIIDDEKTLLDSLRLSMEFWGYSVKTFENGSSFMEYLKNGHPDLIFLDIHLPDINGMDILKHLSEREENIPTVMITAHGDIKSAIEAMKLGAHDYLNKPFDLEEIKLLIGKTMAGMKLAQEVEHRRERDYKSSTLDSVICECDMMKDLLEQVRTIARADETTVIMRGESGTGKDVLAKAIHNLSGRSAKQFIEINCASFPESLLESELFGYEKGAFTDAKSRKSGLIELADGGTLFLDEIGEMPLFLQAKLLKFLEARSFRRIGGINEISVDVRIISATNKDLEQEVDKGNFRQDLFYRLNVFPLYVPALKERDKDVLHIADYYISQFAKKFSKDKINLSDDAKKAFLDYPWPGNVRELKNLCERLVILARSGTIEYQNLPAEMRDILSDPKELAHKNISDNMNIDEIMLEVERELIDHAMRKTNGVKQEAAKVLGISRHAFLRKLKKLELHQK